MLSFIHLQNLGLDDVLSEARHFSNANYVTETEIVATRKVGRHLSYQHL
jgi:hypothetical protein